MIASATVNMHTTQRFVFIIKLTCFRELIDVHTRNIMRIARFVISSTHN